MSRPPVRRPHAPPALMPLAERAAAEFGVTVRDLRGPGRHASLARARFAFAWTAWFALDAGVTTIGRWLGRDHSTIVNAVARARTFRESDPDFRAATDRLRASAAEAPGA